MDFSTWLSIIGIILTCVGLLVTVNKTKTIQKNSHNQNVSDSFNNVKVMDKRKTIYEHHEHRNHHQYTTINPTTVQTVSVSQSDKIGIMIVYGFLATAFFGLSIFYFIQYKELIMRIFTVVLTMGFLITFLVAYYKRSVSVSFKYYLIIYWFVIFGLIILINNPIYQPEQLDNAIGKFSNIKVTDAPRTLWDLQQNRNKMEAYFLIFQIAGLGLVIFYILNYFALVYKIITNKALQPLRSIVKTDGVFIFIIVAFISGALVKFIDFLQR